MVERNVSLRLGLESCEAETQNARILHPDDNLLIDYMANRLAPEHAVPLAEHLTWCSQCSELILDFAAMDETSSVNEKAALPEEIIEAQWRNLEERMAAPNNTAKVIPFFRRLSFAYSLAASFLLAAILGPLLKEDLSLPTGVASVSSGVAQNLPPDSQTMRSNKQTLVFSSRTAHLSLNSTPAPSYERFYMLTTDSKGGKSTCDVNQDLNGNFPIDFTSNGDGDTWVFKIYGVADGTDTLLGTYTATFRLAQ